MQILHRENYILVHFFILHVIAKGNIVLYKNGKIPPLSYFQQVVGILSCIIYFTNFNSTRLFFRRPSAVLFDATGLLSPYPCVLNNELSMPILIR